MWLTRSLWRRELLARILLWLREKLTFDASQVGLSDIKVGIGQSYRTFQLNEIESVSEGQILITPGSTDQYPGSGHNKELCKGYSQSLRQGIDVTYVNLGTFYSYLGNEVRESEPICNRKGGAFVVVRDWESQSNGEGRQFDETFV